MQIHKTHIALAAAALMLGAAACTDSHPYDKEQYIRIVQYLSPVDSVDQHHQWLLTTNQTYSFTANAGQDIQQLRVYNADPLTDTNAEVLNQTYISDGETVSLTVSMPMTQTTLYAALVDGNGNHWVKSFATRVRNVRFPDPTQGRPTVRPYPQAYTYLFEEDMPQPGDYDYNDLVLRIAQQRTGRKEVTISVSIAAVGADYQLAGALRLVGYRFEDIDSVKTTDGKTFNDGVPQGSLYLFDNTDILQKGRNNEAVINLFVDAHWAMAFNAHTEYGLFHRMKYNVAATDGQNYQERAIRTINYVVYFKDETGLNGFTLDTLDPFILAQQVGGRWETHLDEFRDASVLVECESPYTTAGIQDLPWALKVPKRDFEYPREGCEIGFRKRTTDGETSAMFGAYMTLGHSFGEWAENCLQCLDWYNYPTANMVW